MEMKSILVTVRNLAEYMSCLPMAAHRLTIGLAVATKGLGVCFRISLAKDDLNEHV